MVYLSSPQQGLDVGLESSHGPSVFISLVLSVPVYAGCAAGSLTCSTVMPSPSAIFSIHTRSVKEKGEGSIEHPNRQLQ